MLLLNWIFKIIPTVPTTTIWTKPVKLTQLHNAVLLHKIATHFSPPGTTFVLTGALKWGTVWTSTSNSTGIMKG